MPIPTPPATTPRLVFPALRPVYDRMEPLAYVMLRVGLGLTMATHGWPKLLGRSHGSMGDPMAGSTRLIDTVLHLPAPAFFALLVALLEGVGGLMLAAGLLTRPIAVLMVIQTAAICYVMGPTYPWIDRGFEYPLVLLMLATYVVLRGAGRWSLDTRIGRTL